MARKDPVTPELRRAVLARDGSCVAALLDPKHLCGDQFGWPHGSTALNKMTLDHVQEGYGRMGVRAPSDMEHLVTLCGKAHLATHWATSHRPELREYLVAANAGVNDRDEPWRRATQRFEG